MPRYLPPPPYTHAISYRPASLPPIQHQHLTPAWDDHAAGRAVPVTFPKGPPTPLTLPQDSFVTTFISQRYDRRVSGEYGAITGPAPHDDGNAPDALVAFRENIALVMATYVSPNPEGAESYFLSGNGRTIHPAGFEVCGIRTIRIPRQIMDELLKRPSDPRNLYVLAAAVMPNHGYPPRPLLKMTWVCGNTPDHAITRWRDSTHGIAGPGERLVCVTPIEISRAAMDGTLRHPPTAVD